MSAIPGMTLEDPQLIGFVASCLWRSAITTSELRSWCDRLIAAHEVSDLPEYIFDLAQFDAPPVKLSKIIGFEPGWRGTKSQQDALYGIARLRGHERYEWPVKPAIAERALQNHPEVLARFAKEFPSIQLPPQRAAGSEA